uniref:Uncharacterized protein n=1 Tax=Quercus lobata TaxID=97700 RepID=A0A7N2LTB9_QUELO
MEEYEELDMVNTENINNANGAEGVDVDDMKKRLKEMEEEVAALHEMQAKVESHMVLQGLFWKRMMGGKSL